MNKRQAKFFDKLITEREGLLDDPFWHVFTLIGDNSMKRHILHIARGHRIVNVDADPKNKIASAEGTKFTTYKLINPEITPHRIYKSNTHKVPEYLRISFTRMRTSSHRLRVETGRWARIHHDRRLCECNLDVQDEEHVLNNCPFVANIRQQFNLKCFPQCLQEPDLRDFHAIHAIVDYFT